MFPSFDSSSAKRVPKSMSVLINIEKAKNQVSLVCVVFVIPLNS